MSWTKLKSIKQAWFFYNRGNDEIRLDTEDRQRNLCPIDKNDFVVVDDSGASDLQFMLDNYNVEIFVNKDSLK